VKWGGERGGRKADAGKKSEESSPSPARKWGTI